MNSLVRHRPQLLNLGLCVTTIVTAGDGLGSGEDDRYNGDKFGDGDEGN